MNLLRDFDDAIAAELVAFGYRHNHQDDALRRYCIWHDIQSRSIPLNRYTVHFSDELRRNPLYAANRSTVDEIADRLCKGLTVAPYLSEKSDQVHGRDDLLLYWGIHHLHLRPINSLQENGKVKRSKKLLFLRIKGNDVYLIDVRRHSNKGEFEDLSLLEVVDRNWPHLHMKLNGILPSTEIMQAEDTVKLRKANIFAPPCINGRVILPTTGVTSSGAALGAVRQYDDTQNMLNGVMKLVREEPFQYFPTARGRMFIDVRLIEIWQQGIYIREMLTNFVVKIKLIPDQPG